VIALLESKSCPVGVSLMRLSDLLVSDSRVAL
jgi:hypothetical protein